MSTDIYKKIPGSKNYYVTSDGVIFRKIGDYTFKKVNVAINKQNGYHQVSIQYRDGDQMTKLVHRLVAEAFIPKPKYARGLEIDHINSCKADNDISNLRWVSRQDNMTLGWVSGRFSKVARAIRRKRKQLNGRTTMLTDDDVRKIRDLRAKGFKNKELGFIYKLSEQQICRICNRRSFANVL